MEILSKGLVDKVMLLRYAVQFRMRGVVKNLVVLVCEVFVGAVVFWGLVSWV